MARGDDMARYRSNSSDAQAVGAIILLFVYAAAAVGFLLGPIIAALATILFNFVTGLLSVFMIMGRQAPHVGKTLHGTFFKTILLTIGLTVVSATLAIATRSYYPVLVAELSIMSGVDVNWDSIDLLFDDPFHRNAHATAISLTGDIADFTGRIFPALLLSGYVGMIPRLNWFIRTSINASGSVAIFAIYELYAPQVRASLERWLSLPSGFLVPEGHEAETQTVPVPFTWENVRVAVTAAFVQKAETILTASMRAVSYFAETTPSPEETRSVFVYLSELTTRTRGNIYTITREFDFVYFVLAAFTGSGAILTLPIWFASLFKRDGVPLESGDA